MKYTTTSTNIEDNNLLDLDSLNKAMKQLENRKPTEVCAIWHNYPNFFKCIEQESAPVKNEGIMGSLYGFPVKEVDWMDEGEVRMVDKDGLPIRIFKFEINDKQTSNK